MFQVENEDNWAGRISYNLGSVLSPLYPTTRAHLHSQRYGTVTAWYSSTITHLWRTPAYHRKLAEQWHWLSTVLDIIDWKLYKDARTQCMKGMNQPYYLNQTRQRTFTNCQLPASLWPFTSSTLPYVSIHRRNGTPFLHMFSSDSDRMAFFSTYTIDQQIRWQARHWSLSCYPAPRRLTQKFFWIFPSNFQTSREISQSLASPV